MNNYMDYTNPEKSIIKLKLQVGLTYFQKNGSSRILPISKLEKFVSGDIAGKIRKAFQEKHKNLLRDSLFYDNFIIIKCEFDEDNDIIKLVVKPASNIIKNTNYTFSETYASILAELVSNYGDLAADSWLEGDMCVYESNPDEMFELALELIDINISVSPHMKYASKESKKSSKKNSKKKSKKSSKKYSTRPSPNVSAQDFKNKVKTGNDGNKYKSIANSKGIYQWKKL